MSQVTEGDFPEILSNVFEKCNHEKNNLRSNGKLLKLPSVVQDNSGEAYQIFYLASCFSFTEFLQERTNN